MVDFRLSDEQLMLRQASRELLADHCSIAAVRAAMTDDGASNPKLWSLAADLGWLGLALPEKSGGSGQGLAELALVAEEIGRAAARGPFVPTMLVGLAVSRLGSPELQADVLPALADGTAAASWAHAEPASAWSVDGVRTTATPEGDVAVLAGSKTLVQDVGDVRWILVTAMLDGEVASFLVDRDDPGVHLRRQQVIDLTRGFWEVRLDQVRVPRERWLTGGVPGLQSLLDAAAVLTSAELLGLGERMMEMTVEYAKVRVQFGRAIGSFQAVKHKCADMRVLLQGVRAATYAAAMLADAGSADASRSASVAKAFASESLLKISGEALQVHGGIGFTWEHDLHLLLRRAKADAVLHGDAATHHERVCAALLNPDPSTSRSSGGNAQ